jgi:hypothetical protein
MMMRLMAELIFIDGLIAAEAAGAKLKAAGFGFDVQVGITEDGLDEPAAFAMCWRTVARRRRRSVRARIRGGGQ